MFVEMKVKYLTFDPSSNTFAVFLSDVDDNREFPIRIGPFAANAIFMRLKKLPLRRPTAHDLLRSILTAFDSRIMKIEVTDVRGSTYYALIHIECDGKELTVDARPSDAIVIALATQMPIFVAEQVLSKVEAMASDPVEEWLEKLNPEDFKYRA